MAQEIVQRCDSCGRVIADEDETDDIPPIVVRISVGVPQTLAEGKYYDPEALPRFARALLGKLHQHVVWCMKCAEKNISIDEEEVDIIEEEGKAEREGKKRPDRMDRKLRNEARDRHRERKTKREGRHATDTPAEG